jgi:serine/threonine protein kinase
MLEALIHLQKLGFAHRDIKPENILVANLDPLHVKLADLGFTKPGRDGDGGFLSRKGTPKYLAPEIASNTARIPYSTQVDMWSLGIVILVSQATRHNTLNTPLY